MTQRRFENIGKALKWIANNKCNCFCKKKAVKALDRDNKLKAFRAKDGKCFEKYRSEMGRLFDDVECFDFQETRKQEWKELAEKIRFYMNYSQTYSYRDILWRWFRTYKKVTREENELFRAK